ncbi:ATP-binding cassette domain-containing protein [Dactylosporangium sp. NPDC049140]|uniref:ATP-binding cassette domain-containing protein n=1 Tax=Dactylosporangium sp. NPDC049140 TaxID=3155647 RepID=UPI0033E4B6F4
MTAHFVGEHLTRTFGRTSAVRDVTCTVPSNARIAVTGPSGSGKSTLLHLIAGIDEPSSGTVGWPRLSGHPRHHPGRVGIVLQRPALLPTLDVGENVALPLLLAGRRAESAPSGAPPRASCWLSRPPPTCAPSRAPCCPSNARDCPPHR